MSGAEKVLCWAGELVERKVALHDHFKTKICIFRIGNEPISQDTQFPSRSINLVHRVAKYKNGDFYLADEYEMCCVKDASSNEAVIFLEEQ
jgi:hypothetical protein